MRRPHQVHRDEEGAARQPVGEAPDDRRDADIGDHLDRQRGPEHGAGPLAGEFEGEQAERDRHETRADQRDYLGGEQVTVGAVGEDLDHGAGLNARDLRWVQLR